MPLLTGGEIVTKYLIREGIKYVIGIPGHGKEEKL
jgi:thiamine pyrophosphate-dependent acetolactate synthase large subunit-like protein